MNSNPDVKALGRMAGGYGGKISAKSLKLKSLGADARGKERVAGDEVRRAGTDGGGAVSTNVRDFTWELRNAHSRASLQTD